MKRYNCKHEDGWIIENYQDFEILLFDGDLVEAEDIKVICNNTYCQETKKFIILGGIAQEVKDEKI